MDASSIAWMDSFGISLNSSSRLGVSKSLRQRSGETGNHMVVLCKLLIGFLTAVPAGKRDHRTTWASEAMLSYGRLHQGSVSLNIIRIPSSRSAGCLSISAFRTTRSSPSPGRGCLPPDSRIGTNPAFCYLDAVGALLLTISWIPFSS